MRPDLEDQMARMLDSLRQTRERLVEAQARVQATHGQAASRDNLITCAVTPNGGIAQLTISPRAMQRYSAEQLAATIQEVVAEAQARLAANVTQEYRDVLGEGFDPGALASPEAAAEMVRDVQRKLEA